MKFKFVMCLLFLSIVYVMFPVGKYEISDVSVNVKPTTSYANAFKTNLLQDAVNKDTWADKVVNSTNPKVDGWVNPVTTVQRDGSFGGTIDFRSGWTRKVENSAHRAFDSASEPTVHLGLCPAGQPLCDDTALIAPISGVVDSVSRVSNYPASWNNSSANTWVSITGEGEYSGTQWRVMHMSDIPDYIVPGYEIKQGEFIGFQCSLGWSTGSHMHLDVSYVAEGKLKWKNRVDIREWFPDMYIHETIESIRDTSPDPEDMKGWTKEQVDAISKKERYSSTVVIPEEFKVK